MVILWLIWEIQYQRLVGQWRYHGYIVGTNGMYIIFITIWLVVSVPLKNISQLGWLLPNFGKIKNVPNHQPAIILGKRVAKEFPTSINFGQSRRNWVLTDIEERPTEWWFQHVSTTQRGDQDKMGLFLHWLVVSTPLKNISQWVGISHILWKIKNVWNHQPEMNLFHQFRTSGYGICGQSPDGCWWPDVNLAPGRFFWVHPVHPHRSPVICLG